MKQKYFIILTSGRTGSTLLVKLLNTGTENNSFYGEFKTHPIEDLSNTLKALNDHGKFIEKSFENNWVVENLNHPYYKRGDLRSEKWKIENLEYLEEAKQQILLNYFKPKDKTCGYKQLFNRNKEAIQNILDSTDNVYFLVNTRNPEELSKSYIRSGFSKNHPSSPDELESVMQEYKDLVDLDKDRIFEIDYSEFTDHKNQNLKKLFDFVGLEYNESKIIDCLNFKLPH